MRNIFTIHICFVFCLLHFSLAPSWPLFQALYNQQVNSHVGSALAVKRKARKPSAEEEAQTEEELGETASISSRVKSNERNKVLRKKRQLEEAARDAANENKQKKQRSKKTSEPSTIVNKNFIKKPERLSEYYSDDEDIDTDFKDGRVEEINQIINEQFKDFSSNELYKKHITILKNDGSEEKITYTATNASSNSTPRPIIRAFRGDIQISLKEEENKKSELITLRTMDFDPSTASAEGEGRLVIIHKNKGDANAKIEPSIPLGTVKPSDLILESGKSTSEEKANGRDTTDYHIERQLFVKARDQYHTFIESEKPDQIKAVIFDISQNDTPCETCFNNITSHFEPNANGAWKARTGANRSDKDRLNTDQDWLHHSHWEDENGNIPELIIIRLGHSQTFVSLTAPSIKYFKKIGGEVVDINQKNMEHILMPNVSESSIIYATQANKIDDMIPSIKQTIQERVSSSQTASTSVRN